jgi:hypothetical protein
LVNPYRHIPEVNHGSTESSMSYVINRLIDMPGQTYISLSHGRPAHLSPNTIQTVCYKLVTEGICEKEGHGDTALFRITPHGLDKLPKDFNTQGRPGAGGAGQARNGSTHSKGPGSVSQLPIEARAPLAPVKGKPAELHEGAVIKRSGHLGAVPMKEGLPAEIKAAVEAQYNGPMVILLVGEKPRQYPVAIAKQMYAQLKEFFG